MKYIKNNLLKVQKIVVDHNRELLRKEVILLDKITSNVHRESANKILHELDLSIIQKAGIGCCHVFWGNTRLRNLCGNLLCILVH